MLIAEFLASAREAIRFFSGGERPFVHGEFVGFRLCARERFDDLAHDLIPNFFRTVSRAMFSRASAPRMRVRSKIPPGPMRHVAITW